MVERLSDKELVTFKGMIMTNSIQVDALVHLLIEKGLITKNEFHGKLRDIMIEYYSKEVL